MDNELTFDEKLTIRKLVNDDRNRIYNNINAGHYAEATLGYARDKIAILDDILDKVKLS